MPTPANVNAATKAELRVVASIDEVDAAGNIVWPGGRYGESVTYNPDGTVDQVTTTDGSTVWTQTYAFDGNWDISTVTVTDATNTWIDTYTFSSPGVFQSNTGWILQ